jgi:hypothetical protein
MDSAHILRFLQELEQAIGKVSSFQPLEIAEHSLGLVLAVYAWRAIHSCTQTSSFSGLAAALGTQMTWLELKAVVVCF